MMIYNTLGCPVILTLADKTYRMENESELDVKLPAGERYFSVYRIDPDTGEPLCKYRTHYYPDTVVDIHRGKLVRTQRIVHSRKRRMTAICMGAAGMLTVNRSTKLYIREQLTDRTVLRIPYNRYCADVLDLLVENGEITHQEFGCADDFTRHKIIRSFWIQTICFLIGSILAIVISAVGWIGLAQKADTVHQFIGIMTANPLTLIFIILPVFALPLTVFVLLEIRKRGAWKYFPVLPTVNEWHEE